MRNELLHVVAVLNNPNRWQSRIDNFRRTERWLLNCGINLTTVECAYGDRPFDLPPNPRINRVQVRATDVLWQKENLINVGFSRIPDWDYGAYIDGDCTMANDDFGAETVQELQIHNVAQISSHLVFLGPKGEHLSRGESILSLYRSNRWDLNPSAAASGPHGYPGLGWAFRRDVFEALNGLLDICIVGSGDYHMARALLNLPDPQRDEAMASPGYWGAISAWCENAHNTVHTDVGLVAGTALHFWHGSYASRGYETRPKILIRNQYDPDTDVYHDRQGVLRLKGNKPGLRDDLRAYFASRNEDSNTVDGKASNAQ